LVVGLKKQNKNVFIGFTLLNGTKKCNFILKEKEVFDHQLMSKIGVLGLIYLSNLGFFPTTNFIPILYLPLK
jgi:hypothetical protein